jgi:hypothetical protein
MSFFSNLGNGLYNAEQSFLHGVRVVGNGITHPLATAEAAIDNVFDLGTHLATDEVKAAQPFINLAASVVSGANDLVVKDVSVASDSVATVVDSAGGAVGGILGNLSMPLAVGAAVVGYMLLSK